MLIPAMFSQCSTLLNERVEFNVPINI